MAACGVAEGYEIQVTSGNTAFYPRTSAGVISSHPRGVATEPSPRDNIVHRHGARGAARTNVAEAHRPTAASPEAAVLVRQQALLSSAACLHPPVAPTALYSASLYSRTSRTIASSLF